MLIAKTNNVFKEITPTIYMNDKYCYPYELYQKVGNELVLCWPDISIKKISGIARCSCTCWVAPLNRYIGIDGDGNMYESLDGITYTSSSLFYKAYGISPIFMFYDEQANTLCAVSSYRPFKSLLWRNVSNTTYKHSYYTVYTPAFVERYLYIPALHRHVLLGMNTSGSSKATYQIVYSDNGGLTWTAKNLPFDTFSGRTFYWKNKCYYFPVKGDVIWSSTDGLNWTSITRNVIFNGTEHFNMDVNSACWGSSGVFIDMNNTRLIFFAGLTKMVTSAAVLISYDAVNWTVYDISSTTISGWVYVEYSSKLGYYYTINVDTSNTVCNLYYSKDGIIWKTKQLNIKYRYPPDIIISSDNKCIIMDGDVTTPTYQYYFVKINRL